jgi:hypothetical protein
MLKVGATGTEEEEEEEEEEEVEGVYSICVTNYNDYIGIVLCTLL